MSNNSLGWKNCKKGDVVIAVDNIKILSEVYNLTLNKEYTVIAYYACCDIIDIINDVNNKIYLKIKLKKSLKNEFWRVLAELGGLAILFYFLFFL